MMLHPVQCYLKRTERLRSEQRLRCTRGIVATSAREALWDGKTYLNFSSNNYLGLSHHPIVIARSREYLERYGAGSGASQLISGNGALHGEVEAKVAALKGAESALIFPSGFQANAASLAALLDKRVLGCEALVFSDKLNHASIHDGCSLAGVRQIRYRHTDLNALETALRKHHDVNAPRFIVSETVFSMDGDVADVAGLAFLAKKYDALLYLDEAHATGILGKNGMGLAQNLGTEIPWISMGTFSKALGSSGAYIACASAVRDYLVNRATGFVYTTALAPAVLGAMDAALDLVPQLDKERAHLLCLAERLRAHLRADGLACLGQGTPIVPLVLGDDTKALQIFEILLTKGILAVPIRPPTVPEGSARIRLTLTSAHTLEDLDLLLAALGDVCAMTLA
jgi:8-amino-7-oxononanoate synthase